jgi:hypothetical protein
VCGVKSKSKYARVGEFVKITVPKEFVRCGYPLSIKGIMNDRYTEIEKHIVRMYAALKEKPALVEVSEPDMSNEASVDSWLSLSNLSEQSDMSATVHGMLGCAVAAWMLEKENFGGKDRSIFEQENYRLKERPESPWVVTSRKLVKTGRRFPSKSYYSSYSGEYDYEPGGLDGEKTHCVYSIQRNGVKLKVLAVNCARLS